ncbi:unnamed protein product [Clonostachys byssicola]|uniref:DUF7053 domain-containing protein n=1 Tax=Clonostachys byssicola TaxID=160290 RepID=A0A9N9U3E5_9HYPO|nr:unnamed protein product [Clonostachys byssicola]
MASWFNSTVRLTHVTPIPEGITAEKAISVLREHEFFIKCDPHMISYSSTSLPDPPPSVPAEREVTVLEGAEPACFEVVDRVHTLPAGLWDSDVTSTYEFVDIEGGMFVRIRSSLAVCIESTWEVREREGEEEDEEEDGGRLELVEDVILSCPYLLAGALQSSCEEGYPGVHEKMLARFGGGPDIPYPAEKPEDQLVAELEEEPLD